MGIISGQMGDYKRQEKFYREAAWRAALEWPFVQLALSEAESGRTQGSDGGY